MCCVEELRFYIECTIDTLDMISDGLVLGP